MVDLEPLRSRAGGEVARELWHQGRDEASQAPDREPRAVHRLAARAQTSSRNWTQYRAAFVKVFPKEYRRALAELGRRRKRGISLRAAA